MKKLGFVLLLAVALLLVALGPTAADYAMGQPAQAAEGSPIRLLNYTFDPLAVLPQLPAGKALSGAEISRASTYIVQFSGPVQDDWKHAAEKAGAKLGDYIPENAFIARIDPAKKAQVAALPFVRWVGVYQPAYKLPKAALDPQARSYRVVLAPGVDPATAVSDLKGLGIQARSYGAGLSAVLDASQVSLVTRLDGVTWVEPYTLQKAFNDIAGQIMNAPTAWPPVNGYDGRSVTINVTDTGLDTGNPLSIHQDFAGRVAHISSWPVQNVHWGGCYTPTNVGADDGAADVDTGHGTHVTGSAAGNGAASNGQFKGLAYAAKITFQAVEQYTTWACGPGYSGYELSGIPDDPRPLMVEAYNWGARVQNDSWGGSAPGEYDLQASYFDDFINNHKDFAVAVAAGNSGVDANPVDGYVDTNSLQSPATAKNVLTIGASDNVRSTGGAAGYTWGTAWPSSFPALPTSGIRISSNAGYLAAFSSRGPTADGRIKPDLVAPGTNILSTKSSMSTATGWGYYNQFYMYDGGTSMASPLAAGAAALVTDYYIRGENVAHPSAALVKATLINTAVDLPGYGNPIQEAGQPIPNMHEGWGRIDVGAATTLNRRDYVDYNVGLGTAQTFTAPVTARTISSVVQPLKVTLVWSDAPGAPAAGKELVNDLNLRVTAPDGTTVYLGNVFSGGWSTTGGSADNTNNVECVYIQNPVAGLYKVEVIGANVPQGPQAFALVTTGDIIWPNHYFIPYTAR